MSAVEHAVNATRLSTLDLQRNITALELATVGLEQRAHAAEKALEEALQEAGRLRARVEELEGVLRPIAEHAGDHTSHEGHLVYVVRKALGLDGRTGARDIREEGLRG